MWVPHPQGFNNVESHMPIGSAVKQIEQSPTVVITYVEGVTELGLGGQNE